MSSSSLLKRSQDLFAQGRRYFPGVLVAAVVGMAATFISDSYGGPVMLLTLLLGMAFVFLSQEGTCPPGIEFASKKILRLGVALLGARITLDQILELGPAPIIIVIAAVVLTILFGGFVARRLGFSRQFGTLTGGSVAICGASAALAISSVLPKHQNHERDTIFTVISVTTLSTVAMVLYPMLSKVLGFDDTEAGLMLGGTIHDVAQVVGAGYLISDTAGDVSTVTKLFRVALLVPAVLIIAVIFNRGGGDSGKAKLPIPGFLFGFIALVTINSLGWIPQDVLTILVDLSRWCLVTAIAALGMKTSIKALADVGGKAVALIVIETLFILALVVGLLLFVV
ncbi:YeiH family protein [Rhodovibrionaceae bacterium A322]